MTFKLYTPHCRMMATLLAGIAQFERDLLGESIKSGQRPTADKVAGKVIAAVAEERSYRWIARDLAISKNTVLEIMKRYRKSVL